MCHGGSLIIITVMYWYKLIIFRFFFCIVCLLALAFFTSFTQAAFKHYIFILPTHIANHQFNNNIKIFKL